MRKFNKGEKWLIVKLAYASRLVGGKTLDKMYKHAKTLDPLMDERNENFCRAAHTGSRDDFTILLNEIIHNE